MAASGKLRTVETADSPSSEMFVTSELGLFFRTTAVGSNTAVVVHLYSLAGQLWSGCPTASFLSISEWENASADPDVFTLQQGDDRILKISQKKFCASGPHNGECFVQRSRQPDAVSRVSLGSPTCAAGEDCPSWMVPISICTSEDPKCTKLKVLLDRPETTITLSGVGADQWVKVCFFFFPQEP